MARLPFFSAFVCGMRAREAPSFFGRTRRRSVRRTAPGGVRHGMRRGRRPFFQKRPESRFQALRPYWLLISLASGICQRGGEGRLNGLLRRQVPVTTSLTEANRTPRQSGSAHPARRGHACLAVEHGDGRRVQAVGIRRFGQAGFQRRRGAAANLLTISSVVMYSTNWTAASRFSGSLQAFSVM